MATAPSRKALTHERIVDTAARAIRRGGFSGVGVADIMKEAGLTHGGFYAHFPSRDALLVEALAHAGQQSAERLSQGNAQREARGASPFRALIDSYLSDRHLSGTENGCAVAALVVLRANRSVKRAKAMRTSLKRMQTLLDLAPALPLLVRVDGRIEAPGKLAGWLGLGALTIWVMICHFWPEIVTALGLPSRAERLTVDDP